MTQPSPQQPQLISEFGQEYCHYVFILPALILIAIEPRSCGVCALCSFNPMGSSNITRGFSASHISYYQRLHPSLTDDTTPARSTAQTGLSITEKESPIFTVHGSLSHDHEGAQPGRGAISKDPTNDNDGSIDWEDLVSESDISCVDDEEPFLTTTSPLEKLSQPSLLTTMMCQSSSTTAQPAEAIGAGSTRSSPAMQLLHPSTNGPSLTTLQNDNNHEKCDRPIPISNSGDMSALSFPVALSPTTTRENMLAQEQDKSLRYHLNQEHKQISTTVNAGFSRRRKPHNMAHVEGCSSQEYRSKNQQARQGNNNISTQSICTEQFHENKSWNYYFDNGPW